MPLAKRETSALFRTTTLADEALQAVLTEWEPKMKEWYDAKVADDSDEKVAQTKLGFDEWMKVVDRLDLVGDWEVPQLSEITGDDSTKGNLKLRLSIPQCKAAFMDSQKVDQLEVGQAVEATNTSGAQS